MLSFRQITATVLTFMLFMVSAALVMNLRYKPLDEGQSLYLDTWTGKIQSPVASVPAPRAPHVEASARGLEIILLQKLSEREAERHLERRTAELERLRSRLERQAVELGCRSLRFAFPAPVGDHTR